MPPNFLLSCRLAFHSVSKRANDKIASNNGLGRAMAPRHTPYPLVESALDEMEVLSGPFHKGVKANCYDAGRQRDQEHRARDFRELVKFA